MQSNFSSLQKPNQMSERKCRAVFLTDNEWSLTQNVQFFCLPFSDLVQKCQFCAFNESTDTVTRKWAKLYRPFQMHYARARVGNTLQ